jgi:glutathione peroxidase
MKTFYDFSAKSLQGSDIAMSQYADKVVLIVNTASKCGFTPQYAGLEKLYEKYRDRGFVVLGFPCNQFGNQEPGSEREISEGCLINYGVSFPMFSKIDVNGDNAHPLFVFLKNALPGCFGRSVKWNFTKFLIDRSGRPVRRFSSFASPESLEKHILRLL